MLEVRYSAASAAFYLDVLGLKPVRLREYEAGQVPFVSARVGPGCVLDHARSIYFDDPDGISVELRCY